MYIRDLAQERMHKDQPAVKELCPNNPDHYNLVLSLFLEPVYFYLLKISGPLA